MIKRSWISFKQEPDVWFAGGSTALFFFGLFGLMIASIFLHTPHR